MSQSCCLLLPPSTLIHPCCSLATAAQDIPHPCAVPGDLTALFSLTSVNVTLSTWAFQDSQLDGDPHNALLLAVSQRSSVALDG